MLFGECLWIPLFKQHFILVRTLIRIYDLLLEFFEEVIQRNRKIDQEPDRDHWCINDWLRRVHKERDKLAVWQSLSDHECQGLRLRRLGALPGVEKKPRRSLEGKISGISRRIIWNIWIASMVNQWSSSGKYALSKRFKNLWLFYSANLSSSKARSSSCQCTTTQYGENEETKKIVRRILIQLRIMLADFIAVIGHSWDLDQKRNDTGFILISLMELGIKMLKTWGLNSQKSFIQWSALETGKLRSKGGCKKTSHFNGSEQNFELILQLSIHGAVADMCREVSKDTMEKEKPESHDPLESMAIPTELSTANPRTDEQRRRNLLQEYEQKFEQLSDNQKSSKLCSDAGLKTVERGQYFITLDTEGPNKIIHLCREYTLPRNDPRTRARSWFVGIRKLAKSWTYVFVIMKIVIVLKLRSDLRFKTKPLLGFELWMELKSS